MVLLNYGDGLFQLQHDGLRLRFDLVLGHDFVHNCVPELQTVEFISMFKWKSTAITKHLHFRPVTCWQEVLILHLDAFVSKCPCKFLGKVRVSQQADKHASELVLVIDTDILKSKSLTQGKEHLVFGDVEVDVTVSPLQP
jgi:hypothetical protein